MTSFTTHYTPLHPREHVQSLPIVWFDIDNTLYSRAAGIDEQMGTLIGQYFVNDLGLSSDEAHNLHQAYFRDYGLAIRGLVKHHAVDPMDYNNKCDMALPLEQLLKPNPATRRLLERIDRSRFRVMGLTNAYKSHALRVLRILELEDLFEGVVSCDYQHPAFACKPEAQFFEEAVQHVKSDSKVNYFVDDSPLNVRGALKKDGWQSKTILFLEGDRQKPEDIPVAVRNLEGLEQHWPEIFQQ